MPGTRVSLYPMGPARGSSQGLEWPIDGIDFAPGQRVGTSNRATGLVSLRVQGPMLLMLPRDCLGTVADGDAALRGGCRCGLHGLSEGRTPGGLPCR